MRFMFRYFNLIIILTANQPRFVNGAWWYFTNGLGFAPNSNNKQTSSDTYNFDYDELSPHVCS
jgi:hypothetical protein